MHWSGTAFDEHATTVALIRERCLGQLDAMLAIWVATISDGGKIIFFGNGGSAADAQHLAAELTGRFTGDRDPLAGLALTTDTSSLTAVANDYGVDQMFRRQLAALGKPGDLALALSTSGNSPNVVTALQQARDMGMTAAGLSAGDGGKMAGLADPLILVPSSSTARIQEMHILIGHLLCGGLETELGLV